MKKKAIFCGLVTASALLFGEVGASSAHAGTFVSQSRQMSEEMISGLHKQLREELNSAYLYQGMALYFDSISLEGFAHWFRMQADEEQLHADKIITFLLQRDVPVVLPSLDAPSVMYASPLAAFHVALGHEQQLTDRIYELYTASQQTGQYDVGVLLHWYLNEQVEEEGLFKGMVDKLEMVEGDFSGSGLLLLDAELGSRAAATLDIEL